MNVVSEKVYLDFGVLVHKVRRERKGGEEQGDPEILAVPPGGVGNKA